MRSRYYAGDPRWITARYAGICAGRGCEEPIAKGDRIFYYPKGKKAYAGACAEAAARDFADMSEAEAMLGGQL